MFNSKLKLWEMREKTEKHPRTALFQLLPGSKLKEQFGNSFLAPADGIGYVLALHKITREEASAIKPEGPGKC
jgi:hypothetical protein